MHSPMWGRREGENSKEEPTATKGQSRSSHGEKNAEKKSKQKQTDRTIWVTDRPWPQRARKREELGKDAAVLGHRDWLLTRSRGGKRVLKGALSAEKNPRKKRWGQLPGARGHSLPAHLSPGEGGRPLVPLTQRTPRRSRRRRTAPRRCRCAGCCWPPGVRCRAARTSATRQTCGWPSRGWPRPASAPR